MRLLPPLIACACTLGAACGRFGFDPPAPDELHDVDSARGGADGDDALGGTGVGSADEPLDDDDAGTPSNVIPGLVDAPPAPGELSCEALTQAWRCSTFDDPELAEWDRVVEVGGTVVAADGTLVTTSRLPGGRAAVFGTVPETTRGDVYLRASVLVPSSIPTSRVVIARIGSTDLLAGDGIELAIGAGGQLEVAVDGRPQAGSVMTRDEWACISLHLVVAETGRIVATVDGATAIDVADVRTDRERIDAFDVGIAGSGLLQLAATVLVDDVAIGPEPIGCGDAETSVR